jgi:hypothetical protein
VSGAAFAEAMSASASGVATPVSCSIDGRPSVAESALVGALAQLARRPGLDPYAQMAAAEDELAVGRPPNLH